MKNTILVRAAMSAILSLFVISTSAFADAVIRSSQGTIDTIIPAVSQFATDLGGVGGSANPDGGSYTTGFRLITWDEVPNNLPNNSLPLNFYNTAKPRGVVLSSPCSFDDIRVSNITAPLHFGNYNANYASDFKHFGGPRLLSGAPGGCNYVDVYFYIPGTKIPATVNGFGVIFTDVDTNTSSGLQFFGIDGQPLGQRYDPNASNNGVSFIGVSFNGSERIARVRIFLGTGVLGDVDISRGGSWDVVVMDYAIYGEPRAIGQHSSDFDGDGTSDYAVFRPANGTWYVMQSGSNTLASTQFGMNGDIPVDGDFDGDSRNDRTVFRPSTGAWYTLRTSNGQFQGTSFGLSGDKPVAGDYDKDGVTDIAVWRPSNGNYYYLKSSNGQFVSTHFGASGDIPIGAAGL